MQDYYGARLRHRAESQSVRKATNRFKSQLVQLLIAADWEWTIYQNEHQRCINDFWSSKFRNWTVIWSLLCITDILAAFIGTTRSYMVTIPFWEWASMARQRWSASHFDTLISDWLQTTIHEILATFWGKNSRDMLPTPFWEWASIQHQQFLVL